MAITTAELITKLRAGDKVTSAAYDPAKQAEGYAKRLEGAGVNVAEATDDRGWFGKLLNLNQDQGFLGDVFEIIDRPLNAISAALMGEDIWESFSGKAEKEYTYIDVLKHYGVDDTTASIAGLALNIVADPLDLMTFGVGKFVKAAGYTSKLGDAAKAINTVMGVADVTQDSLRAFETAKGALNSAEAFTDFFKGLGKTADEATSLGKKAFEAFSKTNSTWKPFYAGIDEITEARRAFFKPKKINEGATALGKAVNTLQNINPLNNTFKMYNLYQGLGTQIIARNAMRTVGKIGTTFKSVADIGLTKMIGAEKVKELWKGVDSFATPVKKLFGFFDEQSQKLMSKLNEIKAKALGEESYVQMGRLKPLLEGKANVTQTAIDSFFDSLSKSTDAVDLEIFGKGKDYFMRLVNTAMSENQRTVWKATEAIEKQLHLNGITVVGGKVTTQNANIDRILDLDFDDFTNFEIKDLNDLKTMLPKEYLEDINSFLGEDWSKASLTGNVKKAFEELQNSIRKATSSTDKITTYKALSSSAGQADQDAVVDYLESVVKSTSLGDQKVLIHTGPASTSAGIPDTMILVETEVNGKKRWVEAARFEVKGFSEGKSFKLGGPSKKEIKVIVGSGADEKAIESTGLHAVIEEKMAEYLGVNTPDGLAFQLQDPRISTENYLRSHPDLLFVDRTVKGASPVIYSISADEMSSIIEEIRRTPGADKFVTESIITRNKEKTVKSTKRYIGSNSQASFAAMDDTSGIKLSRVEETAKLTFSKNAYEKFTKMIEARKSGWKLQPARKRFGDFLDPDISGEVRLDEESFLEFKAALDAADGRPGSKGIAITDLFEREELPNGAISYVNIDNAGGKIKTLLENAKQNPTAYHELNSLLEVVKTRPNFIDPEMRRYLEHISINRGNAFGDVQKAYTDMMTTYKKAVDEMGGMMTRYGQEFGENYVRHTANGRVQEELSKILTGEDFKNLYSPGMLKSVNKLNARKYDMSVYEANQILNQRIKNMLSDEKYEKLLSNLGTKDIEFFTYDLNASALDFFMTASSQKRQTVLLDAIVSEELFYKAGPDNPNPLIRPMSDPNQRMIGYEIVSKEQFKKQAYAMSKYMEEGQAKEFLKKVQEFSAGVGGDPTSMLVDSNIYSMIGRLGDPEPIVGALAKTLDWANGIFKKTKLLSPGFHLRNFVGNAMNLSLSGVPAGDISKIMADLPSFWKIGVDGPSLIAKVAEGSTTLTKLEMEQYELFSDFVRAGFLNSSYGMNDLEELIKTGDKLVGEGNKADFINKMLSFNAAGNEYADRMFRLALFDYARKNPAVYLKAGFQNPAQFVRFSLFDPKDLTTFEKNVMRRIIPFYTFTKKNLMYQLANFAKDPIKYAKFNRVLDASYSLVNASSEDAPEYQVENMYIPIPFTGKDGEFLTFKANLPQSDLNEWINDPLKRLMGSFTPLLRSPYELATNTQIYTGLPIQEYEGQKGYKLPFVNRTTEYLISQTGLDVPIGVVTDIATGDIGGALGFGTTNIESAERSKAYDELNELKDIMSYYKQQGVRIPTIAELENQRATDKLDQILLALNG